MKTRKQMPSSTATIRTPPNIGPWAVARLVNASPKQRGLYWLALLWAGLLWLPPTPLYADSFRWAREELRPEEQAPEGLRRNISIAMVDAIEGLFQPRFQYYFRDNMAYYVQLQFGTNAASSLNFAEEYNNQPYERMQLGFEFGITHLLYSRNPRITKDIRRWGSGFIFEFGFRGMLHNISRALEENIIDLGANINQGWQLQARNFSISFYLQLRLMLQFNTEGKISSIENDLPMIIRGPLSRSLPEIIMINGAISSTLAEGMHFTFSQSLNIRISYYF